VPRLSSAQIEVITDPADGLLVYNTTLNLFCFCQDDIWYSMQAFKQKLDFTATGPLNINENIRSNDGNVGIGVDDPHSQLSVAGNMAVGANVIAAPTNGAFIQGQVRIGSNTGFKKLEVDGEIHATETINTQGKIQENGNDLLPVGSIIMYGGSPAPAGWMLCNGATFNPSTYPELYTALDEHNTLPDLRGRFIMGSGDTDEVTLDIYGNQSTVVVSPSPPIRTTGGYDKVAISVNQMPVHDHDFDDPGHRHTYDDYFNWGMEGVNGDGGQQVSSDDEDDDKQFRDDVNTSLDDSNITFNSSGGNEAHENRPPYYVLSFIIKVE
jgi:microcystin-dependent protein